MSPIRTLLKKEWSDIARNRLLLVTMLLPALLFLVISLVVILVIPSMMKSDPARASIELRKVIHLFQNDPELRQLDPNVLYLIHMLRQFLVLFLIVPVMSSLSIATYSIIGEKQNRTLEPLLATPITTAQLLIGKTLAATLPSVFLFWILFFLYAAGLFVFTPGIVPAHVLNRTAGLLIFLIGPLIAFLGLIVGVIVSARSTDPRSAQQIGAILILPVIGLFVSQLTGLFFLTLPMIFAGAVILILIDFFIFRAGVALFKREKILTQWK